MSRTRSVATPILLAEYEGNLKRLNNIYDAEDAVDQIEAICIEEPIRMSDLPNAVPQELRRTLADYSAQMMNLQKLIEHTLADLEQRGQKVLDALDKVEEAKKPHCEKCGAVLVPKRKR